MGGETRKSSDRGLGIAVVSGREDTGRVIFYPPMPIPGGRGALSVIRLLSGGNRRIGLSWISGLELFAFFPNTVVRTLSVGKVLEGAIYVFVSSIFNYLL